MKKILLSLCLLINIETINAYVGEVDKRDYVDWNKQYPEVVKILHPTLLKTYCTGQYISKNLIITAAHCLEDHSNDNPPKIGCYDFIAHRQKGACMLKTSSCGENEPPIFGIVVLASNNFGKLKAIDDYAILYVDKDSEHQFNVSDTMPSQNTQVDLAGFGNLRKIEDWEYKIIRRKLVRIIAPFPKTNPLSRRISDANNIKILGQFDKNRSSYNYKQILDDLKIAVTKSDFDGLAINELFEDAEKLKIHRNCKVSLPGYPHSSLFTTTCQGFEGTSGGFIANTESKRMIGINVAGYKIFTEDKSNSYDNEGANSVEFATKNIFQDIKNLLSAELTCIYTDNSTICLMKKIQSNKSCELNCVDLFKGNNIKSAKDNGELCTCVLG